jgi:hypothetical protein
MLSTTCIRFVPYSLSVLQGLSLLLGMAKGKKPQNLERKCCTEGDAKVVSKLQVEKEHSWTLPRGKKHRDS